MAATSKRAKKIVSAKDVNLARLVAKLRAPKQGPSAYAWTLADIRCARDAQLVGNLKQPARLAAAMRTDDALFVAYQNRLAPQRGLPVKLVPPNESARAKRVLDECDALYGPKGIGVIPGALESINGDLANHGIAFAVNHAIPREDGSRVDFEVHHWPIEFVRWDAWRQCFVTQIDPESAAPGDVGMLAQADIVHGDGRWIVFSKHEYEPFAQEACVLAAAMVWADHAYGKRDRSKVSTAVGNEKWLGKMAPGTAVQTAEGTPTEQAEGMLELLADLASDENPIGLLPDGYAVERMVNMATQWQIYKEILDGGGISASRIYLGQDATLGSQSQGPGVDASTLWGVRNDIVEGDLTCIERGLHEGSIRIWTAVNFGDSALAPWRKYQLPDPDEDARIESMAARNTAFNTAIADYKKNGFEVTQDLVNSLAKDYQIQAPTLALNVTSGADLFQYDLELGIVTINEARARKGFEPIAGGERTVPQALADAEAITAPAPSPSNGAAPAGRTPQAAPKPAPLSVSRSS